MTTTHISLIFFSLFTSFCTYPAGTLFFAPFFENGVLHSADASHDVLDWIEIRAPIFCHVFTSIHYNLWKIVWKFIFSAQNDTFESKWNLRMKTDVFDSK